MRKNILFVLILFISNIFFLSNSELKSEVLAVSLNNDFRITKGPMLQSPTPTSMNVSYELLFPGKSLVEFRKPFEPSQTALKIQSEDSGTLQHVKITALEPDQSYAYKVKATAFVKGREYSIESPEYSFRTPPLKLRPFHFAVIGDNRTQVDKFSEICKKLIEEKRPSPEFIVHTGDLVQDGRVYEQWQEQFFTPAHTLLATIPFWPALGNHEHNSPFYYDIFILPGVESYYSFDYLNARFIILNTCQPFQPSTEQYQWLEKTFIEAKSKNVTWIFVSFHHPPYSSGPHNILGNDGRIKEQEARDAQDYLVPLFEKYGVTAVFNGHDHVYERSYKPPIYYLIAGGGGAPLYAQSKTAKKQNPYSQYFESTHNYVLASVYNDRVIFQAINLDGNVIDSFTILK